MPRCCSEKQRGIRMVAEGNVVADENVPRNNKFRKDDADFR